MGSKSDVCSPTDAEGNSPSDPLMTEASSVRMSPNMFSVTTTSKLLGHWMRRMAALSTNIYSVSTPGNSCATSCATSRHSRDVASTLALSTTVRWRRRFMA